MSGARYGFIPVTCSCELFSNPYGFDDILNTELSSRALTILMTAHCAAPAVLNNFISLVSVLLTCFARVHVSDSRSKTHTTFRTGHLYSL